MSLFANPTPAGFPPPRKFQVATMKGIAASILAGHKNLMCMAPTGAGKSYLGFRIAQKALERGKRVTFLCDRITLVKQASRTAYKYGLEDHGIIQGDSMEDWSRPLQIASVQSIASRGWPKTDVLIVDEAHDRHEAWVKFAMESEARVIGLSATPFAPGLGKIFTNLVCRTTMHELTQEKILVPMRVLSCRKPDMAGAKTNEFGEWQKSEAGERGMEIIGDVVAEWMRHAEGRKTIVFAATIAHAEELCRQFNEAGVMAATFTKDTVAGERDLLLSEFEKHEATLRVLISVDALAKGFDVPDVGCVVDCRPLRKSLSKAIQMWGRGLRASPETGKQDCLLLDHSGNITRFAEDFTEIYFNGLPSLDAGEQLDKPVRRDGADEKERKGCPSCGYKPFRQRCMSCGFEIKKQSSIVHEAGEMVEIAVGKSKTNMDYRSLWLQVCTFARQSNKVKSKPGFAWVNFKKLTGRDAPRYPRYEDAPVADVDPLLARKLDGEIDRYRIAQGFATRKAEKARAAA